MNLEIDLTVPPSAQLVQNRVLTSEENRVPKSIEDHDALL
jgi:hypothetical protein